MSKLRPYETNTYCMFMKARVFLMFIINDIIIVPKLHSLLCLCT